MMIFIISLLTILLFIAIYTRVDAKNKEDFEKREKLTSNKFIKNKKTRTWAGLIK